MVGNLRRRVRGSSLASRSRKEIERDKELAGEQVRGAKLPAQPAFDQARDDDPSRRSCRGARAAVKELSG